jgi:acyl transferase domain-containing protein/NAD(P)-dependent dehydrogenase (short-subunit alcohol dehydrogenase family)/acyl carrier protein
VDGEIAIVGVGCRFPGGAESPAAYWDLLRDGRDAVADVPLDRWYHPRFLDTSAGGPAPGKTRVRQAAFVRSPIDRFDAAFFGISTREAEQLDPQQRLLLEVTWEALEDAGVVPGALRGSRTGVFVGCFTVDHLAMQYSDLNHRRLDLHSAAGSTLVMLANRLSFTYDLRGPSLAVDTACSSSLVAVHLACESIRRGECEQALAGGVNLMLGPWPLVSLDRGGFLSPTARCHAFDSRADGYVRGEGAGVVVLKPLARARRDGDPIHGVICATGTNQDGRTPGITLPSQEAQLGLIREVWARVPALRERLAYFEAHGTGTLAGDVIEASALGQALEDLAPREAPCWVGSVKTNVGHLEGAAGVAGLIKAALCLRQREVVPNLHFERPNPAIDLVALGLRIPTERAPLPQDATPLYAAVNSFGYGGSNAHAVVRDEPPPAPPADAGECHGPFLLSARSEVALLLVARRLQEALERGPAPRPLDVAYTAAVRRQQHRHRLALEAGSLAELAARLKAVAADGKAEGAQFASVAADAAPERPVFVYTGMGAQSWGMAQDLVQDDPVVRAAIARCDETWAPLAGWSLLELFADEGAWTRAGQSRGAPMRAPRYAQPTNFALQVALTERWRAWGVEPAAIVGHSAGEFAAAWAAGAIDLAEALRVLFHRSELQQGLSGSGTMLAVQGSLRVVQDGLTSSRALVVAAQNGAESLVLAGPKDELADAASELEARGVGVHWLPVDVPYHHPVMEPLREAFRTRVGAVASVAPARPLYSSVTGKRHAAATTLDYWWSNIVEPARFAPAVDALRAAGHRLFLEVGPHPALGAAITESYLAARERVSVTSSLRRAAPGAPTLRAGLGQLFVRGADVDWRRTFEGGRHTPLPTYPWQGQRLWSEGEASRRLYHVPSEQPLLQQRLLTPEPCWHSELRAQLVPFVPDHRVFGRAVFPAAGSLAIGLGAAKALGRASELRDVRFESMFPVEGGARCSINVDAASGRFTVHGSGLADADDGAWARHAVGRIAERPRGPDRGPLDLDAVRARCATPIAPEALYARATARGLEYGPAFRVVRALWRGEREVLAELRLDPAHVDPAYPLHPVLLDGAFQAVLALVDDDRAALPVGVRDLRLHAPVTETAWAWGRVVSSGGGAQETELVLCGPGGEVLAEVLGLRTRSVRAPGADVTDGLYRTRWELAAGGAEPVEPAVAIQACWLVFGPPGGVPVALADELRARGQQVVTAPPEQLLAGRAQLERLLERVAPGGLIAGVVVFAATAATTAAPDALPGTDASVGLLHLVQALEGRALKRRPHVVVVTQDAARAVAGDPPTDPGAAALWGLGRTIRSELLSVACRLVDVDGADGAVCARALTAELLAPDGEDEVALRGGQRYVARLIRAGFDDASTPVLVEPGVPARLEQSTPGRLEGLVFRAVERRAPGPTEVEVEVRVAAINFKDVLKAQGRLPADYVAATATGEQLGLEVAGVVVRRGASVVDLQVDDEVVCLAAPIATFVTLPAAHVVRRTRGLDWSASASLINFATAHHALMELGRLRAGDRVLIHTAASGVGLAAIQLARRAGAEVLATAGTERKRAALRELGVAHVGDSRSLSFVADVRRWTEGRGVDVVLNALVGEALTDSLELLAPNGRFVEIGKVDILAHGALPLAAFDRGLSFAAFDFDQPAAAADLLRAARAAAALLESGGLVPLPTRAFAAHEVVAAFQEAARGEHLGKLVVRLDEGRLPLRRGGARPGLSPDATYLVTGALGDLGRTVVRWLAREGARHLALVSRGGADGAAAQALLSELRAAGVTAHVHAADVADRASVEALFARLDQAGLPPLRGVFHLAATFRDGALLEQDAAAFSAVFGPKAGGAWWLHQHTLGRALDHFVLFSSISALTGTPGQGSYAAANAFLDGLAEHRRALGLPGVSLAWGPVAGTRVVEQLLERGGALERAGFGPLSTERLLDVLGRALSGPEHLACVAIDWGRWARLQRGRHGLRRLERLVTLGVGNDEQDEVISRESLVGLPRTRRRELLEGVLRAELARVLGQAPASIQPDDRLLDLGVDSMMFVELRAAILERFGLDVRADVSQSIQRTVRLLATSLEAQLEQLERDGEQEAPRG